MCLAYGNITQDTIVLEFCLSFFSFIVLGTNVCMSFELYLLLFLIVCFYVVVAPWQLGEHVPEGFWQDFRNGLTPRAAEE